MPRASSSSVRRFVSRAAWTDAALVRAVQEDDAQAFAALYERYWYQLLELAYRKLNSREAAEEVVQELFATLWHKRQTLHIEHLQRYLFAAVRHRVIDLVKAQLSQTGYAHYHRAHPPLPDRSTEQTLAADELAGALLTSLQQLPEHTQRVFRLSRFEHQSVPEIAGQLNLSRKTVEYHLTRALKMLRVSLREFMVVVLVWLL